jgi:hypothetical protein
LGLVLSQIVIRKWVNFDCQHQQFLYSSLDQIRCWTTVRSEVFLYQLIISKSIDLPFLWIKSLLGIYFSSYTFIIASSIDENKFWSALLMPNSKSTAVFSVGLYFPKKVATWTLVGAISWIMGSYLVEYHLQAGCIHKPENCCRIRYYVISNIGAN